jgi:maltose O-acetyltransferase
VVELATQLRSPAARHLHFLGDHYASRIQAWAIWPISVRRALLRWRGIECSGAALVSRDCYFSSSAVKLGACYLNSDVHFEVEEPATIEIGDGCAIGPETMFVTSHHEYGDQWQRSGRSSGRSIRVEPGCWLGAKVLVLPGVTIGTGCVVAAGAVVAKDCDPNGLYGGVPARRIKDLDQ